MKEGGEVGSRSLSCQFRVVGCRVRVALTDCTFSPPLALRASHALVLSVPKTTRYVPDAQPNIDAVVAALQRGDFDAVYTDGHQIDLALPIAKAAAAAGLPVVADCEVIDDQTVELTTVASVLIAPASIVTALAGKEPDDVEAAVAQLANRPQPALGRRRFTVIATDSNRGSHGATAGDATVHHEPAVDCVYRDSTGAGDSFHAGFLAAIGQGLGMKEAMSFSTRVGAAKVETPGPVTSIESLARFGIVPPLQWVAHVNVGKQRRVFFLLPLPEEGAKERFAGFVERVASQTDAMLSGPTANAASETQYAEVHRCWTPPCVPPISVGRHRRQGWLVGWLSGTAGLPGLTHTICSPG